jgi:hypothetical protein
MLGLTAGREVQVGVVAQHAGRLHGIVKVIFRQRLQSIVGFLIDEVALLDPAFNAARGAHPGEAFFVLQHFHALSVLDGADAVVNGCDLIAQRSLYGRDIIHFQYAVPAAIAGRESEKKNDNQRAARDAARGRQEKFHDLCAAHFSGIHFRKIHLPL